MIPGWQGPAATPAVRVHHPSCAQPAEGCLCPPVRGQVVTLAGVPGRWRVLRADVGRVLLGRAREVRVVVGEDVRRLEVQEVAVS